MSYKIYSKLSDKNIVQTSTCDKYDYSVAACCGLLSGFIDAFFVGSPLHTKTGKIADKAVDEFVIYIAEHIPKSLTDGKVWEPQNGKTIASAIGFLERAFPVPYDHKNVPETGGLVDIIAKNHHYKSLAHSPSPIGLLFSLINQFTNTATFVDKGQFVTIIGSGKETSLHGTNLLSKLFCGFCNWILHIISDMAGSSGSRGNNGRGTGVPIPFMELFGLCNFGKIRIGNHINTLAVTMTKVFQQGYDLRHGINMSIPVILEEMFIKVFWIIRRLFGKQNKWDGSIPDSSQPNLRIMLLVGNSVLCVADLTGALVSGFMGNIKKPSSGTIEFILNLNMIAWQRLIFLGFKELCIKISPSFCIYLEEAGQELKKLCRKIYMYETAFERAELEKFYRRMDVYNAKLNRELKKNARKFEGEIAEMLNKSILIDSIIELDEFMRT